MKREPHIPQSAFRYRVLAPLATISAIVIAGTMYVFILPVDLIRFVSRKYHEWKNKINDVGNYKDAEDARGETPAARDRGLLRDLRKHGALPRERHVSISKK